MDVIEFTTKLSLNGAQPCYLFVTTATEFKQRQMVISNLDQGHEYETENETNLHVRHRRNTQLWFVEY